LDWIGLEGLHYLPTFLAFILFKNNNNNNKIKLLINQKIMILSPPFQIRNAQWQRQKERPTVFPNPTQPNLSVSQTGLEFCK